MVDDEGSQKGQYRAYQIYVKYLMDQFLIVATYIFRICITLTDTVIELDHHDHNTRVIVRSLKIYNFNCCIIITIFSREIQIHFQTVIELDHHLHNPHPK